MTRRVIWMWLVLGGAAFAAAQTPAPRRIISLVPAVTEMLFAIGAGPAVVGVSSHDIFPPDVARLPRVGALVDPDFERILSLRPDLVVVYASQTELIARLARAGIAALEYRHGGLADVTAMMRELGRLTDRAAQADEAARRIETQIDDVRARVSGRPRPSTMLIFGREPGALRGIYASGAVGFVHEVLVAAGGRNVLEDVVRESLQVSVEVLLARAPEVIVEVHPAAGWTAERLAREAAVWQRLPALPAVRGRRVHIVADDRLLLPGPRVAAAVQRLAATLHPDAVAAPASHDSYRSAWPVSHLLRAGSASNPPALRVTGWSGHDDAENPFPDASEERRYSSLKPGR